MRRKTAVSGMSHLKYKERHVQHQEGHICSSRRRLCSVRAVYSIQSVHLQQKGVWCEEIVCSIKNVTPGEEACSSRRVASAVHQEGCAV